ncbi:MAG: hypothetical protein BGP08_18120 [Rhizobiales bacterium 64-17]|nr:MAG: hypothetical protein BGP08_18120 [Rhizobiales bacterium 64-17]
MSRDNTREGRKVLVIDDISGVRESLSIALTAAGFAVTALSNGREGLTVLEQDNFDAVVTDIWMPEMDGLNLIKEIRERQPELRIFAVTGGGPRLSIETAGSLASVWGAERVFIKPFDEAKLIDALKAPPHAG